MFLTKITLGPRDCRDKRLTDGYSVHRLVYDLFATPGDASRILYVDKGARGGTRVVLVLAPARPRATDLQLETKEVAPGFLGYPAYAFETILNPVRCESQSRKRIPVTGQLPLLKWFLEKAAGAGFVPDESRLEVKTLPVLEFTAKERHYVFNRARFSGVLSVTDAERFRRAFATGIGRAKGFGFGLLQLSPLL